METLRMTSPDLTEANIDKIAELFPNVVTESLDEEGAPKRAVDFDMLRQELSDHVVEGPQERYQLDWPGKRAAAYAANAPIAKTLRPVREESVEFDTTKNLFIEGDNLEALKLLQESCLGKVDLIYIDPPYNTGNDFVYADDFAEDAQSFLRRSGQVGFEGERLRANTDSNGRFHSDWLSMIYPRIKLARNLLTEDGFLVVSIDDAEFSRIHAVLCEVFGAANELAVLVWDRNRKNDAKYVSVGHEYMLVFARNKAHLDSQGIRLKEPQAGLEEALSYYQSLLGEHGDDWDAIQRKWRTYFSQFNTNDERRKLGRYNKVGPRGPFLDDGNINWPGGGGPRYEILHPQTGRPCKLPTSGWRFPTRDRFLEEVESGRIVFGPDETTVPRIVSYLFESPGLVMGSVHYSYAQTAAVEFSELMGGRVFDNPKNWRDLRRLFDYFTGPDAIVMDFFAGSASTAHAVLDLNATTGSNRRFVLVQLDESVPAKSPAAAEGYSTISEIARARIRKVGRSIKAALGESERAIDIGFRSFRVDTTNMNDVLRTPDSTEQASIEGLEGNIKGDRTGEDLLFQVLLHWGLDLALPISVERINSHDVLTVDEDALIACFDQEVSAELVRAIAQRRPLRAVFRDSGFASDAERINAEQIFREVSPATDVKAI